LAIRTYVCSARITIVTLIVGATFNAYLLLLVALAALAVCVRFAFHAEELLFLANANGTVVILEAGHTLVQFRITVLAAGTIVVTQAGETLSTFHVTETGPAVVISIAGERLRLVHFKIAAGQADYRNDADDQQGIQSHGVPPDIHSDS